jgi:glycosyltransferase involved in cell wall biosynthesis
VSDIRAGRISQNRPRPTGLFSPTVDATPKASETTSLSPQPQPLVSVIIPTFNRPLYLRAALASALGQTLKNIEIIVQDNASVEDPTPIVAAFGDSRVSISRNTTNIGQAANIVTACAKGSGKYVAILADDDLWQPDFLATLVPPLENDPEIVVSFCSHDYIDAQGRVNAVRTEAINRRHRNGLSEGIHGPFVRIALVNRSICAVSAAVYRRDVMDWQAIPQNPAYGCDNDINCCDHYINYQAARTGKRCYYHPARLAHLRLLTLSATVAATSSVYNREMLGRASLLCWDTFFRDSAVSAGRNYFAMKRADNVLRVIVCILRRKGLRMALEECVTFLQRGVIRPSALLYHLRYGRY